MKQTHSGEITDEFWAAVHPLIPQKQRNQAREYQRKPGGGRKPMEARGPCGCFLYAAYRNTMEGPAHCFRLVKRRTPVFPVLV